MTTDRFRALALALPEAVADAHMGHPDFRVRRKVFATLGHAGDGSAMVKLTPEQQASFVRMHPNVFSPVKGGWGLRGATQVHLPAAREAAIREALLTAWRNVAPQRLVADDGAA